MADSMPIRVVIVAPSMDMIGGQSIQANLLRERLGTDPELHVTLQPINPVLPGPFKRLQELRYVRTLVTAPWYCAQLFVSIRRSDVVHVFCASYMSFVLSATPALLIGKLLRRGILLNYHSGEAEDHLNRWPSARSTLRIADSIVVPSVFLARVFRRFGFETRVILNCVDLAAFRYRKRGGPAPKFLVNRNFEPHYNVECVLKAMKHIQDVVPDASLTVAGDGPQRAQLHQAAKSLQLRNVEFVGRVPASEMPGLYDRHDIWINASTVDNMPLSILEAFSAGLAVVSSNAGGIPDLVDDGRTGLLANCNDDAQLAANALRVLREPGLFASLTEEARSQGGRYDWKELAPAWKQMYSALGRKRSGTT